MFDIEEIFKRVGITCHYDVMEKEVVFLCKNEGESLTELEKKIIKRDCLLIGVRCRFEEKKYTEKEGE